MKRRFFSETTPTGCGLWIAMGFFLVMGASVAVAQENCPVVDFGDDLCWYTKGIPPYRKGVVTEGYDGNGTPRSDSLGDGKFRIGHPFSTTLPLNPICSEYNTRGNGTRFFGGMVTLVYNSPGAKYHWTEGGINANHNGFDDFNYMGYALKSKENTMRAFGVWFWKKEDFLNGGDKFPVTFNDKSRVAVYLSRTYSVTGFKDSYAKTRIKDIPRNLWRGWEDVHLLVQDGEQFYIAQTDYRPKEETLYEVYPTKIKWAKYNPKGPWDFEWDHKNATFEDHEFKDVRAAGWMIAKPTAEIAGLWLKWYAFGMDAVVNRPGSPSWNIPMVKADGGEGQDGLYIARDHITYAQWIKIYKWASRNQYCLHNGYNFNQDGNPGSALLDSTAHNNSEPVTGITWQDAALWCNALSEYEGKTPCYYEDEKFTQPLRRVKNRTGPETIDELPTIYLKSEANGYRLPTAAEWKPAAGALWNFAWNSDSATFDPKTQPQRTVLAPEGQEAPTTSRLAFGEVPSRGHYAIGFRPVRRQGAGKAPTFGKATGVSAWTFREGQTLAPGEKSDPATTAPKIDMITVDGLRAGKTEVTYAQWKAVYGWAELNGYRFDHDGDIGSLKWDNAKTDHEQDEPVTAISALDAMVWCNALSEMNGLKPVYFTDASKKTALRIVHPARVEALPNRETMYKCKPKLSGIIESLIHMDTSVNGYRLATHGEWSKLAGGGNYPSGAKPDPETCWFIENSGQRTHPVGKTKPTGAGFCDLAGNVFEWVLTEVKPGAWRAQCRGGSHRSENITRNAPMRNRFTALASVGQGILIGVAKHEIGFRVVQSGK